MQWGGGTKEIPAKTNYSAARIQTLWKITSLPTGPHKCPDVQQKPFPQPHHLHRIFWGECREIFSSGCSLLAFLQETEVLLFKWPFGIYIRILYGRAGSSRRILIFTMFSECFSSFSSCVFNRFNDLFIVLYAWFLHAATPLSPLFLYQEKGSP